MLKRTESSRENDPVVGPIQKVPRGTVQPPGIQRPRQLWLWLATGRDLRQKDYSMSTYFNGLNRTHTVEYEDRTYAVIANLGDMLLIGNPHVENLWIHTSLVQYGGRQNPPSIPSRGYGEY